jgi:hypothetical protein
MDVHSLGGSVIPTEYRKKMIISDEPLQVMLAGVRPGRSEQLCTVG